MKKRVAVLGGGLIGSVVASDLSNDEGLEVVVFDSNPEVVEKLGKDFNLNACSKDLSKERSVQNLLKDFDIAIGAVPGFLGMKIIREVIEAGKNAVDISFSESDYFVMDKIAKEKKLTILIDCGVAPGMSNILSYSLVQEFDFVESLSIFVGGLPQMRRLPYEYQIVFSPIDVIEEYTRPARVVENGKVVIKEALSEIELIDFPGIGTLEAFNTDGLRSLIRTLNVPNMREKTLRYPGHADKIRLLRDSGFFNKEPIDVKEVKVKPIDVTARLLFPLWQMKEIDKDFTAMRVKVSGIKEGKQKSVSYELLDYYDEKSNTTSMARTTAFPAAIMARMILNGKFKFEGICPPEYISENKEVFSELLFELRERGVFFKKVDSKQT